MARDFFDSQIYVTTLPTMAETIMQAEWKTISSVIAQAAEHLRKGFDALGIERTPQRVNRFITDNLQFAQPILTAYDVHKGELRACELAKESAEDTEDENFAVEKMMAALHAHIAVEKVRVESSSGLSGEEKIQEKLKAGIDYRNIADPLADMLVGLTNRAVAPMQRMGTHYIVPQFDYSLYQYLTEAIARTLVTKISEEKGRGSSPEKGLGNNPAPL
ncbi:MAG TPA: hypothetical protein PKI93_00795 [Alphaproteobacteria bacterium]|nr:hypothetical protein [Alphaproteobacteria bacterium]